MKLSFLTYLIFLGIYSYSQNWSPLGNGTDYAIKDMFADTVENILYVSGQFKYADGVEVNGMAIWNGENFESIGGGQDYCIQGCPFVLSIFKYKGDVYCSPGSYSIGGFDPKGLAKWDGMNWHPVDGGVVFFSGNKGNVWDYIATDSLLYIFGAFHIAGQDTAYSAAAWDGQHLRSIGFPFHHEPDHVAYITCAVMYNDEIYVGGNFGTGPGAANAVDVARFDGQIWHPVGGGIKGAVDDVGALIVYRGELYVGGGFRKSSGNAGNAIMKLNGDHWVDVGGSFDSGLANVNAFVVFQDKLYAFGIFDSVGGGVRADNIAVWDGEKWCGLGSEINNKITAAAVLNDTIFIGGGFYNIDGSIYNNIVKWIGGVYVDTCGAVVSSISVVSPQESLQLYPNPTATEISIDWQVARAISHPVEIAVTNLLGQVIHWETAAFAGRELRHTIFVGSWPAGVYLLELRAGEYRAVGKVVIE